MKPTRSELVIAARARVGVPYLWWAKGRERNVEEQMVRPDGTHYSRVRRINLSFLAFDCSGFGTDTIALLGGPDMRWTHNTKVMHRDWPIVASEEQLQLFDAVLYGVENDPSREDDDEPFHVMWYVGDGKVIGATGGGRSTNIPTPGACVKLAPLHYRRDIVGFRSVRNYVDDP